MGRLILVLHLRFASLILSPNLARASIETKFPNLGSFWSPLNPNGGTYIYADSFVSPSTGVVTDLGTWLIGTGSTIKFEVLNSLAGLAANGPDTSAVLATTAAVGPFSGGLTFYHAPDTGSSATLVAGQTYWFAASVIGAAGSGAYGVGGHTPGFGGSDPGTFWYSNDPTGANYDGQKLTPEMAFQLDIEPPSSGAVPEASGLLVWSLLGMVVGGVYSNKIRKGRTILSR